MKFASLSLLALCLTLAAIPAMADSYNNGPVNGTTDAWAFSGGFQNTESFTFAGGGGVVNNFTGWFWIAPGDSLTGVQLGIGTSPFDTSLFNGTLSAPTTTNCFTNQYGYQVCNESFSITGGPNLGNGNYWLTLQNGTTAFGTQPFWDENSGAGCTSPGCPSSAQLNNGIGTIPSEAFTISTGGTTTTGTTPEPSSILLLGSGILGLAGILRRKLF